MKIFLLNRIYEIQIDSIIFWFDILILSYVIFPNISISTDKSNRKNYNAPP